MFSTYRVSFFFLGSYGSISNLPRDERVWNCFPLSQREDFSLAVWCGWWLNSHVHRCFKTQQNSFQSRCMHSLPEPTITKNSKLGGLNNMFVDLTVLEARSPKWRCGQDWSLEGIWKRICSCLSLCFLNPQLSYLFFTPLSLCPCPHLCPNVSLYISETGWDLEPFTVMIAPGHTSHMTKCK